MNLSLKREAELILDSLTEEKVKVAISFLEFLKEKEQWEATKEILSDLVTMEEIRQADQAWKENQKEEFVAWEKVKREV